jgi:proteasome assembly chaperone (PAC2) family protein
MTKKEIAEKLRDEIGHLEVSIKKVQQRCDRMKQFCLDIEEEIELAENPRAGQPEEPSKFRQMVDSVFGEAPKPKRKR